MIIQGLKANKVEFLFFTLFSFFFYYFIYTLKGSTFLSEDDLAHTILKPTTLFNCFNSSCEGISHFLNDINNNKYFGDNKLLERQIHRISSQYTFLTDLIFYLFFLIFDDWNHTVISMIIFSSLFKFIGLLGISSIFFEGKSKQFFFIFISLVFITTPGFDPIWGQNLTAYFFLICLSTIYFGMNNSIKIIFFILTLLSHANGVVLASVLVLSNFFINYKIDKSYFSNISLIDLIMGTLIISSYFLYYFINLDSAPPQSLYIPEGNYVIKNLYLIYNYFKIIPPASAGIVFMSFIITYLMINIFDKKINLIFLSIGIIYFFVIFTGSAHMIYKKSIFLFTLLFYVSFFVLFLNLIKNTDFKNYKNVLLLTKNNYKQKINFILLVPLIFVFITILENYIVDNPRDFFRAHVSGSINNHNLVEYEKLIDQMNNDGTIFSGSEAGIYYAINAGLYKKKFIWSELKNEKNMTPGIYNYIFNSKIHAGGRLTSNKNVYQFYNSIVLNKYNELILDFSNLSKKPKKIIFGFKKIDNKKNLYVEINTNRNNEIIKIDKGEVLFENNSSDINQLILSTKNNLILTKIKLDNQLTSWPYNQNLSLKISGEIYTHKDNDFFSKKNNLIKFNELENASIKNCKLIRIINDEFTLNFGKIKCY
jgi:hypothetical protein|tara:strand:- start:205 stop:2157 length:1953 start_codon:yes stop_codon:yes gene_type:complete